ncbi:hypothetical protein OS493_027081 [Desmophyllum pertusum]|uniref:Uncharacterized protein n=1 Tax=Desmophyllum pertusum TaxID=174260 RepID=A0A9W9Y9I4_9CNID|nr:hypothetical protein OS493_027081 [Desmophyllum pertusum]
MQILQGIIIIPHFDSELCYTDSGRNYGSLQNYKHDEEEETNSRSSQTLQTVNQEQDTGEIQQQPLQTLDEQSSISQTQPAIPDLQVESRESAFGEGETGSSFDEDDDKTIVNRQTNGSMHVRMDREAHENHQRSDMLLVRVSLSNHPRPTMSICDPGEFLQRGRDRPGAAVSTKPPLLNQQMVLYKFGSTTGPMNIVREVI